MKITKFDPATCRIINDEISKALIAVSEKYGIKIKLGATRYDALAYATKVEVKLPEADASKAVESFKYAELLGLPKDIDTKVISMNGKKYSVVELDLKKRLRPCVIVELGDASEKRYLASPEQINSALKLETLTQKLG